MRTTRQIALSTLLAVTYTFISTTGTTGSERTYSYHTIEHPDATLTTLSGINARGDIVGTFIDTEGMSHGFLLRDGAFTTIDVPGAHGTDARGIGPAGDIVGGYWLPGEPMVNIHGYRRAPTGSIEYIDYPGQVNTIPQRILPNGTILGCYHGNDMAASMFGMWIRGAETDAIPQSASMHNGATPDLRVIAGLFTDLTEPAPRASWGYVVEDGVFTRFRVPGSNLTAVWDVGPDGDLVGVYRNAAGIHGFLREDGDYVSIDYPGATTTRAFGINARGDIVGAYVKDGITRGYVASRTGS
jgi:probable HAF family extracellular repeat protein